MDVSSLFLGVALLILLAAISMRFGVDSREGFPAKKRELMPRGIVWDVPAATRKSLALPRMRTIRPAQPANECAVAPC